MKKLTIEQMRSDIAKMSNEIREIKIEKRLLFGGDENHPNKQLLDVRARMWKNEVYPTYNKLTAKRDEMKEAHERAQWILKSFKKLTA